MSLKTKLFMALKIWIVIYPALTLAFYSLDEILGALPVYQRTLLMTLVLVPFVVFAGVPMLDRAIRMVTQVTSGKRNQQ